MQIFNTRFVANTARTTEITTGKWSSLGGGGLMLDLVTSCKVYGSTFSGNAAEMSAKVVMSEPTQMLVRGGGASIKGGTCDFVGVVFVNNTAADRRFNPQKYNNATNQAVQGGGLYVEGPSGSATPCRITQCRFSGNAVLAPNNGCGGALRTGGLGVIVEDSVFVSNRVNATGGTFYAKASGGAWEHESGLVSVTDTTFLQNRVRVNALANPTCYGEARAGAMCFGGNFNKIITNCTFVRNEARTVVFNSLTTSLAAAMGGAMYVLGGGKSLNITQSRFFWNVARQNGDTQSHTTQGGEFTLDCGPLLRYA